LYWHTWANEAGHELRDHLPKLGVPSGVVIQPPRLLSLFLLGKAVVPSVNTLVRRSAIESVGGVDDSFRDLYEDQVLFSKIVLNEPAIGVNECWAKYRQHPSSICATTQRDHREQGMRQRFLSWLEAYMHDQNLGDLEAWKALRQAQWLSRHPRIARLVRGVRRRLFVAGV
jgi:hypothetical protein